MNLKERSKNSSVMKVAGESIGYATPRQSRISSAMLRCMRLYHNYKVKTVLIEKTDSTEWRTISFYLNVSREGSSDTLYYVSGVSSNCWPLIQ